MKVHFLEAEDSREGKLLCVTHTDRPLIQKATVSTPGVDPALGGVDASPRPLAGQRPYDCSCTEGEVLTHEAKLDRVLASAWQGENGHGSWLAHLARTDVTLHHTALYTHWVGCHYNETIRRETDPLPSP